MMHYAHIVMEAKELGFSTEPAARVFARKIFTTAALLAMMPEEVLEEWRSHSRDESGLVMETMLRLDTLVPEEV